MIDAEASSWIPRSRVRIVIGIAAVCAIAAAMGSVWSPFALVLLLPALGAAWVAFVLTRIRRQLSPAGGGWERRIHDLVIARLALPAGSSAFALDIGCGDASLLVALLKYAPGTTATGVDFWAANWDYAQSACEARLSRQGLSATFLRMDAARLDFPDESFDAVVSVMCFHEVRAPSGVATPGPLLALGEALRVLRPGGAFVCVDRFSDKGDYGDEAGLASVLRPATGLLREPLVATLGIPWPLNTKRSLGPVGILSGRKAGRE